MSHYKLGLFAGGEAGMVDLAELLDATEADPFPTIYTPFAEEVGVDTFGQPVRLGLPVARWHWDWLAQSDLDTLLDYEGHVYARTEKREGHIREFATFNAYLAVVDIGEPLRSESGMPFYGQARGPIEVTLTSMVEV